MEITQFTYFQQMAGIECNPVSVEITYGLERLCMFIQNKKNIFELNWNDQGILYKDVYYQSEKNFQHITLNMLTQIIYLKYLKCWNMRQNP